MKLTTQQTEKIEKVFKFCKAHDLGGVTNGYFYSGCSFKLRSLVNLNENGHGGKAFAAFKFKNVKF